MSVVLSVVTWAAWQGNQKVPGSFDPKPPMLGSSWDPDHGVWLRVLLGAGKVPRGGRSRVALGSPTGWWHLASSCCCWLCPGALLTVPGTSVIYNWFSRAAHHKHAHTHVGVCPNTRVDSHTHGDLSMRPSSHVCALQPRSRTNLTCVATLCTLARHPLAACVHTQEVTQMCTHTQVCTHQRPGFTPATCEARIALPALGAVLAGACLAQLCSNPGAAPGCRWGLSSPPSPRMGT